MGGGVLSNKDEVREKIRAAIVTLNEDEQKLLSRVLHIERGKLYQQKPRVKEDLLKAVREVIK